MNKPEKLFKLLLKDKLTEKEDNQINSLVKEDDDCRQLHSVYLNVKHAVKSSAHPTIDELADYVLFKNNPGEITGHKINSDLIDEHLKKCLGCSEILGELSAEYKDAAEFTAEEFKPASGRADVSASLPKRRTSGIRYLFVSAAVFLILCVSLYVASSVVTPSYYNIAEINNGSESYVTRGRITDDFQKGINALSSGNLAEAENNLKSDIENHPEDPTIFYSYYILGLTYLQSAQSDFLGLFTNFDRSKVVEGMQNLKLSIDKNKSGRFDNITFNADFYLAKASLMLGDKASAENYLNLVIQNKGSRMDNARKMLEQLKE